MARGMALAALQKQPNLLPDHTLTRKSKRREGVQDQLRTAIRRAHELGAMEPRLFNARPEEGKWSVAECLDHLNETARIYLPEIAETIEGAREEGLLARPGAARRTFIGRIIVWTQEPPVRIRMKTFTDIEPRGDTDPAEVAEAFEALHEELIVRINEAADLDWKRVKMRSLLESRLKLSLGDWFYFLAAHARRHLWQAERVKAAIEAR